MTSVCFYGIISRVSAPQRRRSNLPPAREVSKMSTLEVLTLLLLIATIIDIVVRICNNQKK